jgi:hypothetical protein
MRGPGRFNRAWRASAASASIVAPMPTSRIAVPKPARLAFLHTAASHVPRFDALARALGPDLPRRHVVREDLLAAARRAGGVDAALGAEIAGALSALAQGGAEVIVCTCSTLGDAAERAGAALAPAVRVQRVDRAMARSAAEIAAHGAGRACVVAALEVTLAPTGALVLEEAARLGANVAVESVLVAGAWPRFESGDEEGYAVLVAEAARAAAPRADVVVLAQASMADAAERCADLATPILASPRLGVEAALAALRG